MNQARIATQLRWLLMLLVLTLTFEGLARKGLPLSFGIPIFFLKDVFAVLIAMVVLRAKMPSQVEFLWNVYCIMWLLFSPLIVFTAFCDPFLAIYGTKLYLLYPFVGFAVFIAFENRTMEQVVGYFKWCGLLILPTAGIALLQDHLPSGHWLNKSVGGADLGGFSAADHLRVSSTFSFVAQYCLFLMAEAYILTIVWSNLRMLKFLWKIIFIACVPVFVMSCFITGSRTAVIGTTVIIAVALGLSATKLQSQSIMRIVGLVVVLYGSVFVMKIVYPGAFAAYSERQKGTLVGVRSEESTRVLSTFAEWMGDDRYFSLLGHGLGVMSNGSDKISSYAAGIRRSNFWTETDFPTTLFEGGFYLALIWYGFRGYVIFKVVMFHLSDVRGTYTLPSSVCAAFVMVNGVVGTLSLQPPLAIWWWMAVGMALVIRWKCIGPTNTPEAQEPPPRSRVIKGRSQYADVLHKPRSKTR